MKIFALIAVTLMLGACAMKQKVLDASAVSMTHTAVPDGKTLEEVGPVKGTFCTDSSQKGSYGLMDESVKDAQKTAKVDFIVNASFFQENRCMTVEGTGARIK